MHDRELGVRGHHHQAIAPLWPEAVALGSARGERRAVANLVQPAAGAREEAAEGADHDVRVCDRRGARHKPAASAAERAAAGILGLEPRLRPLAVLGGLGQILPLHEVDWKWKSIEQ